MVSGALISLVASPPAWQSGARAPMPAANDLISENDILGDGAGGLPAVKPGSRVQLADYPAGALFGPRRLDDYEFVWLLQRFGHLVDV